MFNFLGTTWRKIWIKIKFNLVCNSLCELNYCYRFFIWANIYYLSNDIRTERHFFKAIQTIVNEREAPLLFPLAVYDGLPSLEHQIDHY